MSRVQKDCMRSDKSPVKGTTDPTVGAGSVPKAKNATQDRATGKKYSGPNYAQLKLGSGKNTIKT